MKRRALISVTDKAGVAEFATRLTELGYAVLSTGGTYAALRDAGVEVEQISDYTGFPEILGGRVKTLHGKVHGGILAPRGDADAEAVMQEHGIDAIDVVVVNLYRFAETAAREGVTDQEVVENIDIGGPAMIRSAAKNHAGVTVVVDPSDYTEVADALAAGDESALLPLRQRLAAKAFAHTAAYDRAVSTWFAQSYLPDRELFGDQVELAGDKVQDLRYGENPHQKAAFYRLVGARGLSTASQLSGKELSYNNIVDLDAALCLVMEFDQPACAIIKHTNPCGSAVAGSPSDAFRAALSSDPMSAFGGIVALNRDLDEVTAQVIADADLFVEAIVAPDVSEEAVGILSGARGGKSLRLLSLGGAAPPLPEIAVRWVHGGFLAQTPDHPESGDLEMKSVTARDATDQERDLLAFAWRVAKHVKSNSIVLASRTDAGELFTVGVGAGQMSRVDSVKIAVEKAGDRARGAVLASDAFFPFPDGLEAAAAAGVTAAVQPGGSRNDESVIAAADAAQMAMVFTGTRHFRH